VRNLYCLGSAVLSLLFNSAAIAAPPPCNPISICADLWVAAHNVGTQTSFFSVSGHTALATAISKDSVVRAQQTINVRKGPGDWDNPPFELTTGSAIRVKELKALPVPGGVQIWLQIAEPSTPAPPVVPAPPPAQLGAEPCFQLPTAMPTSATPVITPPSAHPPTASDIMRLLEGRDIFCDESGLIVHQDSDGRFNGGDTAQREGWYWVGVWIREHTPGLAPWTHKRKLTFDQVLKLLEPASDGVFYRHPKQAPFNNPFDKEWGFSRDQMVPMVAAMGLWGKHDAIRRLWEALPEDLLGKHSFNGNWRNFLGQDGWNCSEIKKMSCSPTADCSLKVDNRTCTLAIDDRSCSLNVDNRDCSQPHDERSCSRCILPNIFTGGCSQMGNDPVCELEKAGQNKIYESNKALCEAAKAGQNALYATQKATCETEKASQNAIYAGSKASCEAQKAGQNAIYSIDKGLCETAKTSGKLACEAEKSAKQVLCMASNIHSGDFIGPATVNLFWRALDLDPMLSPSVLPIISLPSGPAGEAELLMNQGLMGKDVQTTWRLGEVVVTTSNNPDKVGDDLNNIVMLLISKLRHPSALSQLATTAYATGRPHSYGSYLRQYYTTYGDDMANLSDRIKVGIVNGWKPDVSAPYGAVRWYHRASEGANPQLGTLYAPIIERFIK